MKKRIFVLYRDKTLLKSLFVIIIICFINFNCFSQYSGNYSFPKEVKFKEYKDYYQTNSALQVAHFYPIGWSKDSKFAFITFLEEHDACGCIYTNLVIHNLKNDEAESIKLMRPEEEYTLGEISYEEIWKENQQRINKILLNAEIIPLNYFKLRSLPIYIDNDKLSILIKTKKEDRGFEYVDSLKVTAISDLKGSKTIFNNKIYGAYEIKLVGLLKSPYEDRSAVIISESTYGFEGPPDLVEFKIIGCHLTKGFKK